MFLAKIFNCRQDLDFVRGKTKYNPSNIGLATHLYIYSVVMVIKLMEHYMGKLHIAGQKKKKTLILCTNTVAVLNISYLHR